MSDPSDPPARIRNIAELARMAGVSAGTVSRALAGKDLVNKDTRERIEGLARAHGFRPNQMARRLRTQETRVIGVVVPLGHEKRQQLSDPFFMTMLGHLADALTQSGYDIMLSRVIPDECDWLDRIVDSGMLDGVLLIGQSDQIDTIERVAAFFRPLVVWGSGQPGYKQCTVGVDNQAGGRIAAEALIARGCRTIAFMGDPLPIEFRDRLRGVGDACLAAGLAAPTIMPVRISGDVIAADIAVQIAQASPAVDGIVTISDLVAMHTVRTLADRGVAVPERIAVTGFDNLPLAGLTVPRLTTIDQHVAEGAQAMVKALLARIGGEDAASVVMQPHLVRRDTA